MTRIGRESAQRPANDFQPQTKAMASQPRLKIAVIGTGISGLSAAWLLNKRHAVTVYEQSERVGGHSNTVTVETAEGDVPVDTGFIVFNRAAYPNLVALFKHLGVETETSDMSFSASLDGGAFEYAGGTFRGLVAQPRNLVRPRFLSMIKDILRFYREAPRDLEANGLEDISLGDYLEQRGYGAPFSRDHLLPMASAIWSATPSEILSYPVAAFLRFHTNHGLLQVADRPIWETVKGGSISYVERLTAAFADNIRRDTPVAGIRRSARGVEVTDRNGSLEIFDHVVIASHANQALAMLSDASLAERSLLGAFRYTRNLAVLHSDESFMPKRRAAWASWNYVAPRQSGNENASITYWMNRLQNIPDQTPFFVTLNPDRPPRSGSLYHSEVYEHPLFDAEALAAQRRLWEIQGINRTWFCGAYFGYGFHEDGLQSGLAVAEEVGDLRRPWWVANESGRIPALTSKARRVLETIAND
jgi:predicted NAD/FAD-binding protein